MNDAVAESIILPINEAIAVGDLVTAGTAAVAMQLVGGGLSMGSLARDVLTVGGAAVISCQVADIVFPRVESMLEKRGTYSALKKRGWSAFDSSFITRGVIAGGSAYALYWAGGLLGSQAGTARSLVPAVVVGAACAAGHYASVLAFRKGFEDKLQGGK